MRGTTGCPEAVRPSSLPMTHGVEPVTHGVTPETHGVGHDWMHLLLFFFFFSFFVARALISCHTVFNQRTNA